MVTIQDNKADAFGSYGCWPFLIGYNRVNPRMMKILFCHKAIISIKNVS